MSEELLDAENWRTEATAVINDVKDHVKELMISEQLQSTDSSIYLNLSTIENKRFCIQLSAQGFTVVGYDFDQSIINSNEYFETPYSLLDKLSPSFKESFAKALFDKLEAL